MRRLVIKPPVTVLVLVVLVGTMGLSVEFMWVSNVPEWLARKLEFGAKYEEIAKQ